MGACNNKYSRFASHYTFKNKGSVIDYSNLDYWAAHPWKHDPGDSVPAPLRTSYHPDSTVDVFFIHPTTYTLKEKPMGWNASIDNAELNARTDYSAILYQASIFNEAGRVFAPRYRQAHISAYFPVTKEDTIKALAAFNEAYGDVKAAFTYYLEHWNNGRPIIIASHSQGTTHAKRLLKEFFDGKPLQKKLVAAYIAGIPVTADYFTFLTPCNKPDETGCICSWRTFKKGYKPLYIQAEKFKAIVTNPLTWDVDKPFAGIKSNKGAVLKNFNELITKLVDARVEGNVLWTVKPKFFGSFLLRTKNYHIGDYNFFYLSVRENVDQRVIAFWKNKALLKSKAIVIHTPN